MPNPVSTYHSASISASLSSSKSHPSSATTAALVQTPQPPQQQQQQQQQHQQHPIPHLVANLVTAAAELGVAVDSVHFRTPPPPSAVLQWPSVLLNGSPHPLPPNQYPPAPAWPLSQPTPYHFQPAYAQQVHYYNHPPYFATPGPSPHAHAPPNVFWSTVLPNGSNASQLPAPAINAVEQDLVGTTNDNKGKPAPTKPTRNAVQPEAARIYPQVALAHGGALANVTGGNVTTSGSGGTGPVKEFVCPRCNARFKTNSNMQKHVRTVHDNCRPFKCDKCGASYGHKNLLVEHIRTAHDRERPFECETCGARFGRSSNLYSHMKSHDGKREHQCKTCHVSFSLHGNMVKHYKTVHLKQRPFVCDVCTSKFGLRSDLMRHKRNVHGIVDKDRNKDGRSAGSRQGSRSGSTEGKEVGDGSSRTETKSNTTDD